jgi:hypothetical protein
MRTDIRVQYGNMLKDREGQQVRLRPVRLRPLVAILAASVAL